MKNMIKYIACATMLILASCYGKNENNFYELKKYELKSFSVKVNDVVKSDADTSLVYKSTFTKNTIVVNAGDKIDIALEADIEAGYNAEYKWEIYETTPGKDPITDEYLPKKLLANTKDLSFEIAGAPIEYSVLCTIKNSENDVETYVGFIFKINKPNGLAIIYNTDKGGDFDLFKSTKNTLNLKAPEYYKNVFSSANNSYLENPNTLHASKGSFGAPDVFVMFNQGGIIGMNLNTYKVTSTETSKYFALTPPTYTKSDMLVSSTYIYGVFDDKIYFSSAGLTFKYSIDLKNSYLPMLIANDGSRNSYAYYVFFDNTNKAFKYGNFSGGINSFTTAGGSVFDLNNTQMDLIYAESGFEQNVNAIMKKGSDLTFNIMDLKLGLGAASGVTGQTEVKVLSQRVITSLTGISATSLWAMNTRGPRAFYSSGTKIYVYNQENNTSSEFATVSGNITMLKVYKHTNETINSKTLYVGTEDGKLYEFDFDVITGVKVGEPTIYNVEGKPINIKYIN